MTSEACRVQDQEHMPQPTHMYAMEEDIDVTSHPEGLNGLSSECKPSEEITNGHSNHKPVMNGIIIGHNVKDHTNGSAPLTSLPISALKQNGLLQTLTAGGDQPKPSEENVELEKARQEWEALENVQPAFTEDSSPSPLISFNEALQYFQTTDLGDLLKNIQPTIRRTGLAAIAHFLFGPPRLHRELLEERDLVFAIAQCPVDNSQTVHMRVLQTIYKKLVGSRLDCPRYGVHWENIGFQGTDPATDLRGTGFLGLMHTLYFVMDPETLPLARDIYKLSQHPTQNFPFSVMSINMTRIALQVLREEALSKECNRRQQVVGVLNEFYVATYLHLYQLWKTQHKTIADSGFVLKEVELFAKKNPKQMLRRLEVFLKERQAVGIPCGTSSDPQAQQPSPGLGERAARAVVGQGSKGKEMHFTGVCDLPPDMEGEARLI
ncbi:ELMO domain-containing protein 3 [Solea senegalensis]|uniref:ELMO domain-containing protein 3 n=1 Tax=Solea senegalensis TaxID=28829 RepID=A0AAV6QIY6_SOLSE|nr:ELMO domain-containing protein 3 [Solea senegalensis]XP_043882467.1 ELMO domain-containing protein 3 [Solea senegalensis]XP_058492568.1 ELMO domain-containing protein 3 [Solea solea]KAG7490807.1 ELMO domain-containing protein 3 [Solea senegalensis]